MQDYGKIFRENKKLKEKIDEIKADCISIKRSAIEYRDELDTLKIKYAWLWVLFITILITSMYLYHKAYSLT